MTNVVRLAIVDPVDASRSTLKQLLLGIETVWLEAECSRYEFFADVVNQTQPNIALINLDSDPVRGLALVGRLHQDIPNCAVLVVSSSQEGSLILQAMRNGAKEFLSYPPRLEDMMSSLARIRSHSGGREGDGRVRSSRITSVIGVSGGVGCTSLAINVACALAESERNSVAIIDLDTTLGDADVWLDVIPEYTIQDVAENITRLDYSLLKRSLTRHDCGAFLLPRPVQIDPHSTISPEELRRVIALLKATFTHLVIDVSKNFNPLDLTALELSDTILVVTQLDLPCLRNVVRLMQFLDQNDQLRDKVRVVVNRFGLEDAQISLNKALETIGREIFAEIPNDYPTMVESRNNGVPLIIQAPKAKLTKAIRTLANKLDDSLEVPVVEEDGSKKRKGLFRMFKSGTK